MALTDNLVSYWKLDGNSTDSVSTNNGTDTAVTYTAAKINNGASFSATGQINVGNATNLQLDTGTVSFWVKKSASQSSTRGLVVKQSAYAVFFVDGILNIFDWSAGAYRSSGQNPSVGSWSHVVLTFQSGVTNGTKMYLNGSLVMTTTYTTSTNATAMVFATGAPGDTSQRFNGVLDEIGIWSRNLSQSEVTQLYNSGSGNQYPFSGGSPTPNFFPFLAVHS